METQILDMKSYFLTFIDFFQGYVGFCLKKKKKENEVFSCFKDFKNCIKK